MQHWSSSTVWCKQSSGLTVKKKVICQKLSKLRFLSHNVLISLWELLGQRRWKVALCPDLWLEILEMKIRWLVLEILRKISKSGFGSRSRMVIWIVSKNIRCTTRGKGPHVCEVWWLKALRFQRFARAKASPESWRIIRIVPKLRKQLKDSEVIRNLLNKLESLFTGKL